ncbi:MAG: o-succinylbenzoate--CoA ligase [Herbiconiux sp.]|nr:MAG: o-succinylbenzoate--CoA ligase [Herbiconiux sp.]
MPRAIALVIETSGSSGLPKRVALSADALLASAAAAEGALGGPGQWLLALPTHYIAGVQVLVRSIAAGTTPLVLGRGHFSAADFAALADRLEAPVRYTSLVPAQLARLVTAAEADAGIRRSVSRFDAVLVGGQALPAALHERALALGIAVVRTYGSSETAGGCVYDGLPIGQTLARTRGGELELSGPSLAVGYLGDEELNEAKFFTDEGVRWYRTGDAGTIEGGDASGIAGAVAGGSVTVTGRLDNVIISGGIKVSLDRVERIVQWVPGFEEAVVVGAADEVWGQVGVVVVEESALAAAGVQVGGADPLEQVRRVVADAAGRAAAPARLLVVERVSRLSSGKPDRQLIASRLQDDPH